MQKKKATAKGKKLRSSTKLEKQKPLSKYTFGNVLTSEHSLSSGGDSGAGDS
jgi:hypothetical protein